MVVHCAVAVICKLCVKIQTSSLFVQALALLGKLGGRNRRFLKDPLELDLKDNPEHGLRLILTFQPSTSFLVPLDRCLALSSQSLLAPTSALPFPHPLSLEL